ncbi:MAG TPA: T9SS type A sorting domain-containing protein, partial [Phnomibacter sp.]|nr:T9SS type A sorting domain-containing protein [Phnomibacter sp.]
LDSIDLKVQYFNLGRATQDSVLLSIERELPDGTARTLFSERMPRVFNQDSITIRMALKGLFEEGDGFFVARIDPANEFEEVDKDNNVAILPFKVQRSHIMPVYPYNYAIINTPKVKLQASTTDPLLAANGYRFEIDTTALFISPLHEIKDTIINGGAIEWEPKQTLIPNTVYYWRTGLANNDLYGNPQLFSFVYLPGNKVGFNQSHYYQHLESQGQQVELEPSRQWHYKEKLQNIYAAQGIYPSSGDEDSHFSITVNGQMLIRSACLGQSIIFNMFDSASFAPVANDPTGAFGSGAVCGPGREYNFEFKYFNHEERKKIMDFLDVIPKGRYVAARLVVDWPFDSLQVRYWMNDTLIYGSGNSLYHSLKRNGFYDIDSLNRTRTFFFMFRKDDTVSFKPYTRFSAGAADRVYASLFPTTIDTGGVVISPWMGPAKQWDQLIWKAELPDQGRTIPDTKLELWGRTDKGKEVLLKTLTGFEHNEDIGNIPAQQYPFAQLRMSTSGGYASHPAQLRYWRIFYDPVPDGAISGKDRFELYRSVLKPDLDTLRLELAFKNISPFFLGSTHASITLEDGQGQKRPFYATMLRSLSPADTAILKMDSVVLLLEGEYRLLVEINEAADPTEQTYFNNRAIIPFSVIRGALPLRLLFFDARRQMTNAIIDWKVTGEETVERYDLEHSRDGIRFTKIAEAKPFNASSSFNSEYQHLHTDLASGNHFYRIRVRYKDGSQLFSEIKRVVIVAQNMVRVAPNPFNQYFTLQPLDNTISWQLRILDASGKIVQVEKGIGSKRIDMSKQAKGMYWAEWTAGNEIQTIQIVKQ